MPSNTLRVFTLLIVYKFNCCLPWWLLSLWVATYSSPSNCRSSFCAGLSSEVIPTKRTKFWLNKTLTYHFVVRVFLLNFYRTTWSHPRELFDADGPLGKNIGFRFKRFALMLTCLKRALLKNDLSPWKPTLSLFLCNAESAYCKPIWVEFLVDLP